MTVGRFAPSPSGRMHMGNVFCCLLVWLSARQQGGRVVLRVEDLDTARCPPRYARQIMDDLLWLGLDWDEGPLTGGPHGPYFQSERTDCYSAALENLQARGLVYPCFCTRAELHAASAPHRSDGQSVYPGTCRNLSKEEIAVRMQKRSPAFRLRVPDKEIAFTDGRACTGKIWRGSAGTFCSAVPTACLPISWPWSLTTRRWRSRKLSGDRICSLPRRANCSFTAFWNALRPRSAIFRSCSLPTGGV